tara:strand:+ start:1433 stop:2005 length:573 start_codon:yes stop_codon:yes gene_type:complete
MFALKKNYFLIIENIKDISLENIKIRNKFSIIYRNQKIIENKSDLLNFRKKCKLKAIKFFVANDIDLASFLNADGLYLSAFNKSLRSLSLKKSTFQIIGSAHNLREITMKIRQGCKLILLSKLFLVSYDKNSTYLGLVKFNNFLKFNKNLVPLGGINIKNLNNLKNINSAGFALMSEIKKKPAKIISRLF